MYNLKQSLLFLPLLLLAIPAQAQIPTNAACSNASLAIAWSAAVAGTLTLVLDLAPAAASIRTPFLFALVGGFVFGVGAALNRGCSLSTLQRLADGEMSMLVTLAGLVLGVASFSYLGRTQSAYHSTLFWSPQESA